MKRKRVILDGDLYMKITWIGTPPLASLLCRVFGHRKIRAEAISREEVLSQMTVCARCPKVLSES